MKMMLAIWALVGLMLMAAPSLQAQIALSTGEGASDTAATLPDPLTPEAIDGLVSRLSDGEVRALLLDQLNATAVAPDTAAAGRDFSDFFYHITLGAAGSVQLAFIRAPFLLEGQMTALRNFNEAFGSNAWFSMLGSLAIAIALGLAAEWLFKRMIQRWLAAPEVVAEPNLQQAMEFLTRRLVHELLGVVGFVIVANIAVHQLMSAELVPLGRLILIYLVAIPRMAYSVARFLLSPRYPDHRVVQTDDETASFLTRHVVGLALVAGFTVLILDFNAHNGVPLGELRLGFWLDLAFRLYLIWIIWRAWDGLVSMMRGAGDNVSPAEEAVAKAYPVFAIGVVAAIWWLLHIIVSYDALHLLAGRGDIVALVILLMAPAFDTLIRGLVHHFAPPMTGEGVVAERAYAATKAAYKRIGRVVFGGIGLIIIASSWGISPEGLRNVGAVGVVVEAFFDISFVIGMAYLSWELISLVVNRKLAAEMTAAGFDPEAVEIGADMGAGGKSRLTTVLPLLLSIAQSAILVIFSLVALGELGVDTTPLLAGAGIVGLAIGFGAQKLVSDVVSGVFFLVDDAFRLGEYVEVGDTRGTVEKISVRSMQLRHHRGPVHTIPYGEIPMLTNYSRDWGIMKLKFTVPFGTDPDRVRKIFKKIGQDLLEHPELGDGFLQPFKSQGVIEIDDVGMVIRGKFMAKPGKQFMIRKEIFNRVNAAFAANGIEFARREVRVAIPSLDKSADLTGTEKTQVAAAASAAVQDSINQQAKT